MKLGDAYSKQEVRGILLLVFILLSVLAFKYFWNNREPKGDYKWVYSAIDSLKQRDSLMYVHKLDLLKGKDPNTVSNELLLEVGFSKKSVNAWCNFRKSGFVFQKSDDLKKIYGIDTVLLDQVKVRWHFPQNVQAISKSSFKKPKRKRYPKQSLVVSEKLSISSEANSAKPIPEASKSTTVVACIALNSATAQDLTSLSGIGSVYSKRIVKYRNLLGGFVTINQLKEVYGLRSTYVDSIADRLSVDVNLVEKIDLFTISYKKLIRHPYVDKELIDFLFDYRDQFGQLSIVDFAELHQFDLRKINKILPYLKKY